MKFNAIKAAALAALSWLFSPAHAALDRYMAGAGLKL
jgi:hypothetical protein